MFRWTKLSESSCAVQIWERIGSVKTAWRNTCCRADISDLHFHDLRREFGCQLLESKADLHDVREFLGHANVTTTSRYLRSTPVRLVAALERMTASAQPSDEATDEPARTTTEKLSYCTRSKARLTPGSRNASGSHPDVP